MRGFAEETTKETKTRAAKITSAERKQPEHLWVLRRRMCRLSPAIAEAVESREICGESLLDRPNLAAVLVRAPTSAQLFITYAEKSLEELPEASSLRLSHTTARRTAY